MSIPLVAQCYEEVRRLAVAGSVVAAGDFRLRKLVEPLKKSAEKAPVFGKVAEGIERLISAPERDSAPALLELGTLVNAILYTQGETGAAGDLALIAAVDLGVQTTTHASARVLKPLMEALATTGSGRLEIIKEAHQRDAFRDLRLVNLALKALDDGYGEIAEFVASHVLPSYGKAIIPELRAAMNFPGKFGDGRRLKLLYRLDPEGARGLVDQAFTEGSKEVKIAALQCLGDSKTDLPHLLEQATAKAKEVRIAAFIGLGRVHDEPTVVEVFKKALTGKEPEIAVGPASRNRNPALLAFLIETARTQLDALFSTKDKAKLKPVLESFITLLAAFNGRGDRDTEALLLDCFNRRDALHALKGDTVSGADINQAVAMMMASSDSRRAHETLAATAMSLHPDLLRSAFIGTSRVRKPSEMFELFSPLMDGKLAAAGKKSKDPAVQKAEAIREVLMGAGDRDGLSIFWSQVSDDGQEAAATRAGLPDLDPRWLDLAVAAQDIDLVCRLARPGHAGCAKFLSSHLKSHLAEKKNQAWDVSGVIETMIRTAHPEATDGWIAVMQKFASLKTGYYGSYWLNRLVEKLPAESAAKIEAMLPSLPERLIDEVLPHLQTLKAKAAVPKV